MKLKQSLSFLLFGLFAVVSCKKNSSLKPAPVVKLDTGVYLIGHQDVVPGSVLWKNGVATQPAVFTSFAAAAIAVNSNDMYIAGYIYGQTPVGIAAYWKNVQFIELTDGTIDAHANGITVSGKDVYVAGYLGGAVVSDPATVVPANMNAVYWKNGVATALTTTGPSYATKVIIAGSDVYVIGTIIQNNNSRSVYWKNGVLNQVGDPSSIVTIGGIAVQNNNVYIAYTEYDPSNSGASVAYISINGVKTQLANDLDASTATGLLVNGSDVYVTGTILTLYSAQQITAVVWKNNVLQKLPQIPGNNIPFNNTYDIAISGNDVYVAGQSQYAAVYWKNGVAIKIGTKLSYLFGIVVVH